ncbi:PREDICTED: uncharacterized protein LOC109208978 [Nicotiana attenuata]|nr:PREDICTED: uncharacterized protein LOC109208978 [Nicotiana attenuata]
MSNLIINSDGAPPHHIPPKTPDIPIDCHREKQTTPSPSFKDKLLATDLIEETIQTSPEITYSTTPLFYHQNEETNQTDLMLEDTLPSSVSKQISTISLTKGIKKITLTVEDRNRMYTPWKFSVIIKLLGKRIPHQYLKEKITHLWKPTEIFPLTDLGHDFFIVKFSKEENMITALHSGPWFINGYFLSTRQWEPNFVAGKAKQIHTAIWVRLPQLPTEFYDGLILKKIGNSIGKLLKIDACTSSTLRGRYARLCVELPLDQPVQQSILVGSHLQQLVYEGVNFLCKNCGYLGHTATSCTITTSKITKLQDPTAQERGKEVQSPDIATPPEEQWQVVSFSPGGETQEYKTLSKASKKIPRKNPKYQVTV